MKKLAFIVAVCLVLPLLGSCGSITVERQVFAICAAVDVTEAGQFILTLQSPLGQPSTGVSDTGGGSEGYDIFAAQGSNLCSAMHKLEAVTPFPLNFSQLRLLVFSSDIAARYDLRPLLIEVFRFPSVRATACVMISEGKASDLLHAQRSSYGLRLSTHLDKQTKALRTYGYMPNTTLASCLQTIGSGLSDPLLCLGAVNPVVQQSIQKGAGGDSGGEDASGGGSGGGGDDKESGSGGTASVFTGGAPVLTREESAGSLQVVGSNPVEFAGAVMTSNGYVSGYLTAREMVIFNHLQTNATLRCAIDGDHLQLQLIMRHEDFDDLYDEMMALLQKFQAAHSDPFGFASIAAAHFLTIAENNDYAFENRYPTADIYIGTGE